MLYRDHKRLRAGSNSAPTRLRDSIQDGVLTESKFHPYT